jgi:molybdate transport system permease protein
MDIDYSPLLISMKAASISIFLTFFLGVFAARWVVSMRHEKIKMVVDGLLTLPLVLPPTVAGFFLLYVFGVNRPLGAFLIEFFGWKVPFSLSAAVLAAMVMSFPLMYRSARGAFEQVDRSLIYAARTLGMREKRIFWRVIIPLAAPGLASGGILAFARGLGEFGATTMIAGNIIGKTRTLPLAVYAEVVGGNMKNAFYYVAILVTICLVTVIGMNYFSAKTDRYKRSAEK